MDGVLILAHGSKRQGTEELLDSIISKVKQKTGLKLVFPAYYQFSEQNLETGINCLIKEGADSVKVIPMFLFDGTHVNVDIPREIDNLKKKYPNIKIIMSEHLGDDERIAEIVADRITSVE